MQLFKHQQDIIADDPKKCGLFLSTGSGKTLTALSLAVGRTLVIAPKTTRDDGTWTKNLNKLGSSHRITKLHVISKEEMRRDAHMMPHYDTLIIDEAHTVAGVTPNVTYKNKIPYPKTSQVFEAVRGYIRSQKPERLYLLTATPIRSPMSVLALAWLLGRDWDFYKFRDVYYFKLPMHGRDVWSVKSHSMLKERLGKAVNSLGYVGRLSDWVWVPPQTHVTKVISMTPEQTKAWSNASFDFPEPIVLLGKRHQIESGVLAGDQFNKPQDFKENKTEAILDLHTEFSKVLVFAKYTAQIESFAKKFRAEGIQVFELTGATKDRGTLMEQSESSENCIVIAQSSISAGYELPSFRCTVYASESFSVVDHEQSLGRTLRINNLQKNLYVYLVCGEIDKAVRESVENKVDFNEKMYAEKRKTK